MGIRRKYLLVLLVGGIFLFLFHLGGRDLWEPDETRYAVIARDMAQNTNWILPHLNQEVYAEKPPLFFWMVRLSIFLLGESTGFANRLPSALAGLVTLFITFLFGERLFNSRTGFLSSLVLGSCLLFPQISRWMMLDSMFTLFFVLTLFFFYLGFEEEEHRKRDYLLAGLFMGLGILTKGPGVYLTLPIFLIFALFRKSLRKFWCKNLLWGFLLSIGIVLIWWIPASWIGGKDYIHWILYKQAVGTYVEGGKHFHPEPFYFYFIRFPLEFFPWIVFLPTAFILGFRKGEEGKKAFLFLSIWFIFFFLFFTFSSGKKDNYLLPLYPAAALMVGHLFDAAVISGKMKKGILIGLFILAFLAFAGSILFVSGLPRRFFPEGASFQVLISCVLLYLLLGTLISTAFYFRGKRWTSLMILACAFFVFHLHLSAVLPPRLNGQRSMKAFSERLLKRMEPGDELKTFFSKYNGLLYYTNRSYIEEIPTKEQFFKALESPQRVFVVIQAREFNEFKKDAPFELRPIEQNKVGRWNLVLISNR
jgi:hypothetical protein